MKAILTFFIIIILLVTGSVYGQLATYTGSSGTSTAVTGYANETVTSLQNIGFGSNTACGSGGLSGKTVPTSWTTYNIGGPHYYIQITPNTGYQLNVTGFSAGMRVSGTGPTKVRYAYSLDNGVTWTDDGTDHVLSNPGCGSSIASSWSGGTLPTAISSTTNGIIVALFPFAPGAATGTFQANYINVLGTVTLIATCVPPVVTVTPTAPSFCAGGSGVAITASGAGTSGTYSWSPATGLSAASGAMVTATPSATTTYTVTGYTSPTCSSTTTVTATVNPLPAPVISGATSVCVGASTTLSSTVTGGTWGVTNAALATVNSTGMVTGISAGLDTATYTATNACGSTTAKYPVTINPLPIGGTITGQDSVCLGATIALTNPTATAGGTWSSLNTAVATVSGGTVGGASADTTTIRYSVTTVCGTATATRRVVVKALPFAGVISGPDSVCAGTVISLTSSSAGGVWASANNAIASVSATGVVSGVSVSLSTTSISYTVSTFSCGSATVSHAVTVRPQPYAGVIAGTTVICEQSSTTLTSPVAGGVWISSNPAVATISTSGFVYGSLAGSAIITYSYTNSCGTATDTALVMVNPLPPAITGTGLLCVGVSLVLADALPGGVWSSSNTAIASIDVSGTVYGVTTGNATITYANGVTGCYVTRPVTVNLSVPASVTISASTPLSVCAGTVVTYTANIVNGGGSPLYVWSVNNLILSGATSYTYAPDSGDVVRCWVLSSLGCAVPDTASDVLTMNVHHIATPSLTLTTGMGDTVCENAIAIITPVPVDGGTAPTYMWYVNMGLVSPASMLTFIPNHGDVVTVTMTSNEYCLTTPTATATKILTVSPYLTPMVTTTANPGLTVCDLYPVVYTASQVNGGYNPTYSWSVNGAPTTTGSTFSYVPANGDVVQVQLTSSFPCLLTPAATDASAMTVLPVTVPVGDVHAQPGYIIPAGAYDTFTVTILSGGGIAPTYQWYKDNVPMAGATTSVYITNNLINGDSINCMVTNTDQCSGVSAFNYVVIAIGNNVGVTSVDAFSSLALLPNPNMGSFSVKGTTGAEDKELALSVTDMTGRNVYTGTAKVQNGSIDKQIELKNIPAGMYLLQLRGNSQSKVLHFVVE